MKISNTTQKLAQEELRRDELKKQDNKVKQTQAAQKSAVASSVGKSADTSEMSNNPLAQDIKRINSDIGKLQVAQKSLKSIEPDAKKILELSKDYEESLDKTEQSSIKEEISTLKKGIESTLPGRTV